MKTIFKLFTAVIAITIIISIYKAQGLEKNKPTTLDKTTSIIYETISNIESKTQTTSKTNTTSKKESTTSIAKPNNQPSSSKPISSTVESTQKENQSTTKPAAPTTEAETKAIEEKIIELVNVEREKARVKPLIVMNDYYNEVLTRTKECEEYWSHTRPNGENWSTVYDNCDIDGLRKVGENLGKQFTTAEMIMEALMNSEGHRNNILDPSYTHICVAVNKMAPIKEYQSYTLYAVTQHFYKMEG